MLTKNSFLVHIYNDKLDIGHIKQPNPNDELYYVEWESQRGDGLRREAGYGWTLSQIEKTFLYSEQEHKNYKSKIVHTEKEVLEFRLKYD
jgi:hypothetical protein